MMYISLGPNCHAAGNLKNLGHRKISLPFDWLLTSPNYGIEYVTDLIKTNFVNFTSDLYYNHREKVVSKYYPRTEFFHHDLIKNISADKEQTIERKLTEIFQERGQKFIDIITNEDCIGFYYYPVDLYNNDSDFLIFEQTLQNFDDIICGYKNFRLVVYVVTIDDTQVKNRKYKNFKRISFIHYHKNINVNTVYGKTSDFGDMIKKINL